MVKPTGYFVEQAVIVKKGDRLRIQYISEGRPSIEKPWLAWGPALIQWRKVLNQKTTSVDIRSGTPPSRAPDATT